MNPTRGVVRIASRLASASRQAIRTPPVVPPIVRRISVVSNRSNVPEKFQGVPILRHHAIANRAPTVPYFDPAATNLRNLTVITTPHLNDEGPYRKHKPKRILLSGRNRTGIEKRRTVRMFSTSSSPSKKPEANGTSTAKSAKTTTLKTNGRLTWRDATKSPMKALRYSNQLWKDFIHWCKHMWAGMKLLAADVRVSAGILRRITDGKQISRRERNFIVQTGVDLARLVPFSLFLIIPAAEFALPFALRLFPNMLPSQFQDQMKKEEDMKRSLKGRLELAKYLRDVVEKKAKVIKASSEDSELKQDADKLTRFLEAIRSGEPVDPSEVTNFARLFNDEITMDGAVRPQLVAMCKYMGLSPYGNDHFLRFKLRSRLNTIKRDDMQIMWEGGAQSLTDDEVVKACRDRGIRIVGPSKKSLRRQLTDWLDLSQKKEIPGSLMIMSRAFLYTGSDGLKETLGSLPDDVLIDVQKDADVGEASNQERLDEARRQAKLIAMESEVEKRKEKDAEEKRKKKEEEEELAAVAEEQVTAAEEKVEPVDEISDKEAMAKAAVREAKVIEEVFKAEPAVEKTPTADAATVSSVIPDVKNEEELQQEQEDIRRILVSLGELSSESAVEKERAELENLKAELADVTAVVQETGESEGSDLRRFKRIVTKLEREVEKVDAVVGLRMKLLDQDNDGLMSFEECKNIMNVIAGNQDDELVTETLRRLDADADGNISKADLSRLLKELQGESSVLDVPPVPPQ